MLFVINNWNTIRVYWKYAARKQFAFIHCWIIVPLRPTSQSSLCARIRPKKKFRVVSVKYLEESNYCKFTFSSHNEVHWWCTEIKHGRWQVKFKGFLNFKVKRASSEVSLSWRLRGAAFRRQSNQVKVILRNELPRRDSILNLRDKHSGFRNGSFQCKKSIHFSPYRSVASFLTSGENFKNRISCSEHHRPRGGCFDWLDVAVSAAAADGWFAFDDTFDI